MLGPAITGVYSNAQFWQLSQCCGSEEDELCPVRSWILQIRIVTVTIKYMMIITYSEAIEMGMYTESS